MFAPYMRRSPRKLLNVTCQVLQKSYLSQIIKVGKNKKLKTSDDKAAPSSSYRLSPEQLERIAQNKSAAMAKRELSSQTPEGFGETWKKALEAEFSKPYFNKVRL